MAKNKIPGEPDNDKTFDSFIDSIEEEIRNENLQKIWDKYGKFAVVLCCVVFLAIGSYNMWQKRDLQDREGISIKYVEIQNMITAGSLHDALDQLRGLSKISQKDYATLAKLEYAALLRINGDSKAIAEYKELYENKKINKLLKELSYIFYVLTCIDLMPVADLFVAMDSFVSTLKTLIDGSWTLLAKEALAICFLKNGSYQEAKETLQDLAKTPGIPNIMADRAKILLHSMPQD